MTFFAEQYDFSISVLLLEDAPTSSVLKVKQKSMTRTTGLHLLLVAVNSRSTPRRP